jgi:hypothetical protein
MWALVNYTNQEDMFKRINLQASGLIYNDLRFNDQDFVITSRIISADGRSIVTESGTHYLLVGSPEDGWARHCKKEGWELNCDEPLKIGFTLQPKIRIRNN